MFRRYQKGVEAPPPPPSIDPAAKARLDNADPNKVTRLKATRSADTTVETTKESKRRQKLLEIKVDLHRRLLETLNLAVIDKVPEADLRREVAAITREGLRDLGVVLNASEAEQLTDELIDEVTGLGPLEPLLKDETITDILVNTHDQCFVERDGKLVLTEVRFKDEKHLLRVIDKIVSAVGRRVDESQPWVDARLADGSRVNALVPPCAVDGPLLSIRKFSKTPFSVDKLISFGMFTEEMAAFLQAVVATRLNVLVSGGTGSGKTTMLNALSSFIDNSERIVTIEDTAELHLQQTHVGRMESRPPNVEGKGEVGQRDLLKNALRMRPDRIIVGETRGAEVLDMLQAMNTGHDGSMTTIHANNPRDALGRIENMMHMSGVEMPLRATRAQIASAIHVVAQVSRMSDGKRRMTSISEITGMEGEIVAMQEIFKFQRDSVDGDGKIIGAYMATGVRSSFADRFKQWGYNLPSELYKPNRRMG